MTARYTIETDPPIAVCSPVAFRFRCLAPGCVRISDWLSSEHLAISIAEAHHACCHEDWSGFAEAVKQMPRST